MITDAKLTKNFNMIEIIITDDITGLFPEYECKCKVQTHSINILLSLEMNISTKPSDELFLRS